MRSSTMVAIPTFLSLLFFHWQACNSQTSSTRQSVCGPGPHILDQTALDVYVLPRTNVTLQPVLEANRPGNISWTLKGSETKLKRLKTSRVGDNFKIGPVKRGIDGIRVRYSYQTRNSTESPHFSKSAVLRLAESDFLLSLDQGYAKGQIVAVAEGSTHRVLCYTITPTSRRSSGTFSTPLHFWLTKAGKELIHVNRKRYYNRNGCLWMKSLQQRDSGKYNLWIKSCASRDYKSDIDFLIKVVQPTVSSVGTDSSTRHTLTRHVSTEGISPIIQSTQLVKPLSFTSTNTRLVSMMSLISKPLQLILYKDRNMTSRVSKYSVSINDTVRIFYCVSGEERPKRLVTVYRDEKKADNFVVKRRTLRLEKAQKSDSGFYQVIALKGNRRVTSNFTLVVRDVPLLASPYPTKSQTHASRPNLDTNTTNATSSNFSKHSDGLQGWLIGIIVVITILAVAIPTAYLSYRRCHPLRLFCSTHCHSAICNRDSDARQQTSDPVYVNFPTDTVLKPSTSASSDDKKVTISTFRDDDVATADHILTYSNVASISTRDTSNVLPDIITTAATDNTAAVNVKNNTMPLSTVADPGKSDDGTGPMAIYASVNKKKKSTPETLRPIKTERPSSAPVPGNELGRTMSMPVHVTVSLKKTDTYRTLDRDLPDNASAKEEASGQRHTRNDGQPPQRPAPYKASTLTNQLLAEKRGDTKAADGKKRDDDRSTADAAISTPVLVEVQHKSPDDRPTTPANKPYTIQYVDLDIDALSRRL